MSEIDFERRFTEIVHEVRSEVLDGVLHSRELAQDSVASTIHSIFDAASCAQAEEEGAVCVHVDSGEECPVLAPDRREDAFRVAHIASCPDCLASLVVGLVWDRAAAAEAARTSRIFCEGLEGARLNRRATKVLESIVDALEAEDL